MLLSFPRMGQMHLAIAETCRALDIPYLIPDKPGPLTMEMGRELAPEASCLPFSLVLGNMREALEKGADTILMLGGSGPCRFGYFIYLAEKILRDAGYQMDFLIIDRGYLLRDYRVLRDRGLSWRRLLPAIHRGWVKLACDEALARLEREYLARMLQPEEFKQSLQKWRADLALASSVRQIELVRREAFKYVENAPSRKEDEIIRIGLVGDIYTMLEPFANNEIEAMLLDRGVCVKKEMAVSRWFPNTMLPWRRGPYMSGLLQDAYPYLRDTVGGFGLESVANSRKLGSGGVDGIIQLFPLGCMPEIVARSALDKICRDEELPLLSMTLDIHDSNTGFTTRIDAFLDMVEQRRKMVTC